MDEYEHPYIGTKEEDMDAEGHILDQEKKADAKEAGLCSNCLERPRTTVIKGTHLCAECAKRYPQGMPF